MKRLLHILVILTMVLGMLPLMALPAMAAETVVYSQGFEASNGGYTHAGANEEWEWGTPTVVGPAAANSGTKCWGTDLDGWVSNGSDALLTSPAIAIPALAANEVARVRFFGWLAVDYMQDRGEFQVSSDSVNWTTLAELIYKMQGGWTEYDFNVSNYAGGNIYLRFRCYADLSDYAFVDPKDMSGFYIDDVAITISTAPATTTTLCLEAWEDPSSGASCPWVFTWDGSNYVSDNDIYSTARSAAKEYTDYYNLSQPVTPKNGVYSFEINEVTDEDSFTDMTKLITVDHPASVSVAADENGNVWTYSSPNSPVSATDDAGNDVLTQIATQDNTGFKGYNGDYILLDFSNLDISKGATLVLRANGFEEDGPMGDPTFAQPLISIQTQDNGGNWVTRHSFYPRDNWALAAYDLGGDLGNSQEVRLLVASCHTGKYQLIDYVGMDTSPQVDTIVNTLSPVSAIRSDGVNVLDKVSASDNNYASMATAEKIQLEFTVPAMSGEARDFVFVTEGYYVPMGTFFIYTWDGSKWSQRDGWTMKGGDQTHCFDLSLWLPDPAGEYKVRIWQDYWYEYAGIDYVGLTRGGIPGTMATAQDLKKGIDVKALLQASDDSKDNWTTSSVGLRNRWVEVSWEPFGEINLPPTTNPVAVTNQSSPTPTIGWTYNDNESDPQVQYEVQVWTGPGGTGSNVWNPAVGNGTGTSMVYAGSALVDGQTYYARVKAYDGNGWGGWSEGNWTYEEGEIPPEPGPEVGGNVYPANTLVILTPWLVLAIVIAVGTTILIRRRQHQS
jgi:hypothetical protein